MSDRIQPYSAARLRFLRFFGGSSADSYELRRFATSSSKARLAAFLASPQSPTSSLRYSESMIIININQYIGKVANGSQYHVFREWLEASLMGT
jgi:hypothetical protein